jgi:hypothetical protein
MVSDTITHVTLNTINNVVRWILNHSHHATNTIYHWITLHPHNINLHISWILVHATNYIQCNQQRRSNFFNNKVTYKIYQCILQGILKICNTYGKIILITTTLRKVDYNVMHAHFYLLILHQHLSPFCKIYSRRSE